MTTPQTIPGTRLQQLLDALKGRRRLIICTHNNPDPDSIASAYGLKILLAKTAGVRSSIRHGGIIGRASNRALISQCRIEIKSGKKLSGSSKTALALVDAQPNPMHTPIGDGNRVDIVLDHHQIPKAESSSVIGYQDIRTDYGSCSAIVAEYLMEAGVSIEKRLGTALYYGIKTDVGDMGRDKGKVDLKTMSTLFPLASQSLLARIEFPRLSRDYFQMISRGLTSAFVYRDVVVSCLGGQCNPDIIAELADYLLRMEGIRWSFVCGTYSGGLQYSVRATARKANAGRIAVRLAGKKGSAGGHNRSAGGRIELADAKARKAFPANNSEAALAGRFLKLIKRHDQQPSPLWTGGTPD